MENYLKIDMSSPKMIAAAAERNKQPILEVLLKELRAVTQPALVLEVSSGSGQHVAHFAPHFHHMTFQPTDLEPACVTSERCHIKDTQLTNVREPQLLDASNPYTKWLDGSLAPASLSAIININMIHISPFAATQGLFAGAGGLLAPGGRLLTYGPYCYNGVIEPDSNVRFDQTLRSTNPAWGLRDVHRQLEPLASAVGLSLQRIHRLPANNQLLVWEKKADGIAS